MFRAEAMPRRVDLVTHPDCLDHDPGPGHPESRARLLMAREALSADAALDGLLVEVTGRPAAEADLLRVHRPALIDAVRRSAEAAAATGGIDWLAPETPVSGGSFRAALAAAGCAADAALRVAGGAAPAAFALVRPPGHHAGPERAGGYCLFNSVAVAARRAQAEGLARRVLLVDWDVHHCDGTQDVFWEDPSVHVLSVHLSPHYPDTGDAAERGAGPGAGAIRNVPVPHGTGRADYRRMFARGLEASLSEASPDLVLISCGFDALAGDPEGGLTLEPEDLHALTAAVVEGARAHGCEHVAAVLEGGYVPGRLAQGVVNVARALAGLGPAA